VHYTTCCYSVLVLSEWFISHSLRKLNRVSHLQFRQRTDWHRLLCSTWVECLSIGWLKLIKNMIIAWQSNHGRIHDTRQEEYFAWSLFPFKECRDLQNRVLSLNSQPLNCESGRPFKSRKKKEMKNAKIARTLHHNHWINCDHSRSSVVDRKSTRCMFTGIDPNILQTNTASSWWSASLYISDSPAVCGISLNYKLVL